MVLFTGVKIMQKKTRKTAGNPDLKSNYGTDNLSTDYLVLNDLSWDSKSTDWVTYYYEKDPRSDAQKKH